MKDCRKHYRVAAILRQPRRPSAWGFETNYDRGRVDFAGRVTDISCSVALNGGQHAGSGNVWLAPVSGGSPRSRGRGVYETAAVYPGTVKLPAAP